MGGLKFTDIELKQLVRKGLTGSQIAEHLGVSKSAVSVRLKALNIAIAKDITLRSAPELVNKEINSLNQLQKINDNANELLDLLMAWNRGDEGALQILESQVRKIKVRGQEEPITDYKFKDPRELALKAMQEIRGQLKLQLEIFQALFDMQAVQQFQAEVLEVIESVSPEAREQIIARLQQRNAIRSTLQLD